MGQLGHYHVGVTGVVHTVDFANFVQYNTSIGQKKDILSIRSKIICKIS